jgi:hypothetical protein
MSIIKLGSVCTYLLEGDPVDAEVVWLSEDGTRADVLVRNPAGPPRPFGRPLGHPLWMYLYPAKIRLGVLTRELSENLEIDGKGVLKPLVRPGWV